MVGIQGLGGTPEPKSGGPAKVRNERESSALNSSSNSTSAPSSAEDNIQFSSEAQVAAEIARLVQTTSIQNEIRTERVEAARARLEQGSYKNPEVIGQVADKILKYLG